MILFDDPYHGQIIDQTQSMYPTSMVCVKEDYEVTDSISTCFGYVTQGKFTIVTSKQTWTVQESNFISLKSAIKIKSLQQDSTMFLIIRHGYKGIDTVGTVEDKGRLAYIDGCTDTLLVSPPRKGDACLNYLHFPKNVIQTQHLHPSIRMGIVINGQGVAWQKDSWEHPLTKGSMFCLPEGEVHSFKTIGSSMEIIAYHPDSDFGPTDENHPMLNKTLIDHGTN